MQHDPTMKLHVRYGTISHFIAVPVTMTSLPSRRRDASRTVANGLGKQVVEHALQLRDEALIALRSCSLRLGALDGIGTVVFPPA